MMTDMNMRSFSSSTFDIVIYTIIYIYYDKYEYTDEKTVERLTRGSERESLIIQECLQMK
jgi:hypothetical protein